MKDDLRICAECGHRIEYHHSMFTPRDTSTWCRHADMEKRITCECRKFSEIRPAAIQNNNVNTPIESELLKNEP